MGLGGQDKGDLTNPVVKGQRRAVSDEAAVKGMFDTQKKYQDGMPNLAGGSNPVIPDVHTVSRQEMV